MKCAPFFLETAAEGLLSLRKIQLKFRDEARELAQAPSLSLKQKKFMSMAAEGAENCPWDPPRTFFEGLNLLLFVREILALMDTLCIYSLGHPDAMLNRLYEADLDAGRISKEEAFDLICRFMIISNCHYDGDKKVSSYNDHELEQSITIGGCDENGENIFNDITRSILRGHRENDLVFPKVHCRFRADAPREYLHEIALDIWNGRCVHTLFNDATIIPGLMKQGKTLFEARRYLCAGCWNGFPDSVENVDDANYYSLARVLEAMIYQDKEVKKQLHFSFDSLDGCRSAEEVQDTVCRNLVDFMRDFLADYTRYGQLFAEISPHPLYSACLDGCIESGRDETRGGARFNSRVIVLAFLANVVDSILAIKRICFEKKICPLPDFLDAVRHNWADAEALRQEAMKAPYRGDDRPESMALGKHLLDQLRSGAEGLKNERGGDYCFAIWIYREFRYWGENLQVQISQPHYGL